MTTASASSRARMCSPLGSAVRHLILGLCAAISPLVTATSIGTTCSGVVRHRRSPDPSSGSKKCSRWVSTTSSICSPGSGPGSGLSRASMTSSSRPRPAAAPARAPPCPTSTASSLTSSVIAGGASIVKWTTTSEPSASRRSTFGVMRRSAGASETSDASSMSSGRMPSTIVRPSYFAQVGTRRDDLVGHREAGTRRPRRSSSRSTRPSVASTRFIAGDPMNPATNRLTGCS